MSGTESERSVAHTGTESVPVERKASRTSSATVTAEGQTSAYKCIAQASQARRKQRADASGLRWVAIVRARDAAAAARGNARHVRNKTTAASHEGPKAA